MISDLAVCPPAGPARIPALQAQIDRWLGSPALAELLSIYGGVSFTGPLRDRLSRLQAFSEQWNFREAAARKAAQEGRIQDAGGSGRGEAPPTGQPASVDRRIIELAGDLGLRFSVPPATPDVDFIVILGGARLSNLLRPRFAAQLLRSGAVTARQVILLGGHRPVMDWEREATDTYAPGTATELDLLLAGAAAELGIDTSNVEEESHGDPTVDTANWSIRRFRTAALGVPVSILSAPYKRPGQRPTTADTYAFFARRVAPARTRCLAVTGQIYVPYQHFEGVRSLALPFDMEFETVGYPPDWGGDLHGMDRPANYLQELHGAITAMRRLHDAYLASGSG